MVCASTVPSLRSRWTWSPPGSTKPAPVAYTCGLQLGVVALVSGYGSGGNDDQAAAGVRVPASASASLPDVALDVYVRGTFRFQQRQPDAILMLLRVVGRNIHIAHVDRAEAAEGEGSANETYRGGGVQFSHVIDGGYSNCSAAQGQPGESPSHRTSSVFSRVSFREWKTRLGHVRSTVKRQCTDRPSHRRMRSNAVLCRAEK